MCGVTFITNAGSRKLCGLPCRIKEVASAFTHVDQCWNWPNSHNPQTGYGQLSHWKDGKRTLHTAHRESYKAFSGPITDGLMVLHKCDNRSCFNPAHLFLGTQADNMQDMLRKGRGAKNTSLFGEKHHQSKLTCDDVVFIRSSGLSVTDLCERFSISRSVIYSVKQGKTWRHLLHNRPAMSSDESL